MKIKAFCSDIDGTLLNSVRDLSPRLKAVVADLPEGFPVILASSRMPDAMRHLLHDMNRFPQPLISYNGGYVLSAEGEVLEDVSIPVDLVTKILQLTHKTDIHVSLYQGENWYEEKDDYWSQREVRNTKVECTWLPGQDVVNLWSKGNSGAHKVMCMGTNEEISWLFGELHFEHSLDLHLYRSSDTYLEIAPKAISKATGLKKILEHAYDFGLESVVAFGDNYNDIDLIQSVGWGVAVENARMEVQAVANEITHHNKEDGVAATLEKIRDSRFEINSYL
ncbi:Cof-type HAD-IIB family hydrolase [Algoriphagus sp. C2-6-M1]|uniref:Cof-type HAD-IIB family hydrolase n=1 Tax=Algoriphagus persicinus TaxID=3108754 RepID=UPI002B389460|nr:Cof-type HAD-IIB family hydrolase [Algoriphagus sp. C2-6-M1]MEB2781917.1 Cof-type HAD-IIB family hydrolase [Algoriphagus sp. C2-6-M1]